MQQMQRRRFQQRAHRIELEKSIKYKGAASIKLDALQYPDRDEPLGDKSNVERLRKLFREEGYCDRLDDRNHVVAVIDQDKLDHAIRASQTSAGKLLAAGQGKYPKLNFPPGFQLRCLTGQDRVLAAAKILLPGDKRWTVDLYLSGMELPSMRKT